MRKLPERARVRIVELHKLGCTQPEIGERLGVSQWTVSTTITKWKHSHCAVVDPKFIFCPYCGVRL